MTGTPATDSEGPIHPLVARVRLSLWMRLLVAITCLGGAVVIGFSPRPTELFFWLGVALCLGLAVLGATAFSAQCRLTVTPEGARLSYWILYRTSLPAAAIASIEAAGWDTWSYGGTGIKGRPRGEKGLLLNATYDASGKGDRGLLITTTDGRSYRIEAAEPAASAAAARRILGLTGPPVHGDTISS